MEIKSIKLHALRILNEYCYKQDLVSAFFYNGAFLGGEPLKERGHTYVKTFLK